MVMVMVMVMVMENNAAFLATERRLHAPHGLYFTFYIKVLTQPAEL